MAHAKPGTPRISATLATGLDTSPTKAHQLNIDDVAGHLGRGNASLVRIYDEWCYLTFTRGIS